MEKTLLHLIGITAIPNIGSITAKRLIAFCGSAEQVFIEKKQTLEKIPGIGEVITQCILQNRNDALRVAEAEMEFISKHNIDALSFYSKEYPKRLTHCEDSPLIIFSKGNVDFNAQKVISIVGTRKATSYGKDFCEKLIEELNPHQPLIVSGLAFGIDIYAHKAAIASNLPTVAVLAHGLDSIYPSVHKSTAEQMLKNGGLISDYRSKTIPNKENFPERNRIVAGMADAVVVVESSRKGGSLITADLANGYNRDVFAVPGRTTDSQSEGCNALIKSNKAHLIQSVKDIEYIMGWKAEGAVSSIQTQLFVELSSEEKNLVDLLKTHEKIGIDDISLLAKFPMSKTAGILLELELKNVIKSLPGKMYKLA